MGSFASKSAVTSPSSCCKSSSNYSSTKRQQQQQGRPCDLNLSRGRTSGHSFVGESDRIGAQRETSGRRTTQSKLSSSVNHQSSAKNKRQPLSIIKRNLSSNNKASTRQNRGKMSSAHAGKENISTQASSFENHDHKQHRREPFQSVSSNHQALPSQRLPKKLRPAKSSSKNTEVTEDPSRNDAPPIANRLPIDPPGAVLGTMTWVPPNEAYNNIMYRGNNAPSFPSMANWGLQPVPNLPCPSIHGWTMPPFLAPLAATVRHPFTNFVAHHHGSYYQPSMNQYCEPMEEDAARIYSADEDVEEDVDAKMEEPEIELPSTFAPDDVVEKIRSRRMLESLAKVDSPPKAVKPTQNRVLTRSAAKALRKKSSQAVIAHQAASPQKGEPSDDSNQPEVMTVLGKRVTMIDPVRKVFVIDLLSSEQCDHIRRMADDHTREVHESKSNAQVWRTLYTYTKMDLPVCEIPKMKEKYTERILLDVKRIVGEIFDKKKEALALRPRSWKEPHMLLYQAIDGKPHHTGIEMHYDGCDITWQAMLTRNDEYEGGGTYFRCLRKTVVLKQGQVLVHPGELYHKGLDITFGIRTLLVCFTDGFSPKILDDSRQENDDPKYEKNICMY